jgi:hypothetical protein
MKHYFVRLIFGKHRMSAGCIATRIQPAFVLLETFETNTLAEKVKKLVERFRAVF